FITFLNLSEAYSLRKIADIKPIGAATVNAIILEDKVPTTNGKIPNSGCWLSGFNVAPRKKSITETFLKKDTVSVNKVKIIMPVVNIEMAVITFKKCETIFFKNRVMLFDFLLSLINY